MKIKFDFSPNFSTKKRLSKDIKFVIIHYTGMQSAIESLNRLKNPKKKVSCHYIIERNGKVTQMVKDKFIAWHAGKSKWKNFVNLNRYSIGVELVNKGHRFSYQKFKEKQIKSLIYVCKFLKKKYKIDTSNFLGHSDIAPLRKSDPGEKFPWKKLSLHKLGIWFKPKKNIRKFLIKNKRVFFFKNLKKLGYRYFKISKKNPKDKKIIRAFQQHYFPQRVSGKIDLKTMEISHFLANRRKIS